MNPSDYWSANEVTLVTTPASKREATMWVTTRLIVSTSLQYQGGRSHATLIDNPLIPTLAEQIFVRKTIPFLARPGLLGVSVPH